jgi:glutathionyl-hydroquinone reductase
LSLLAFESYSISGRSLTKLKPEELRKEINYWQGKVNQERNKAAIKAGKASSSTIKARFL